MYIELTKEQIEQAKKDHYFTFEVPDIGRIYIELDKYGFNYGEIFEDSDDGYREKFCFDRHELKKIMPETVLSGHYDDEHRCPACYRNLPYKYDYCPKCGQALSYKGV